MKNTQGHLAPSLLVSYKQKGKQAGIHQTSNDELWQQFQEGDDDALERLYQRSAERLFRYGLGLGCRREIIEDAIHDLFVELWRRRAQIRIHTSFNAYLFRAFRQLLLRLQSKSTLAPPDFQENLSTKEQDNQDGERSRNLQAALQQLTRRQREVVILKFFENYDCDEIAQIMKISKNAVYNLLSKSIAALRTIITYLPSIALIFHLTC